MTRSLASFNHCAVENSRLPACIHRWLGEPLRIGHTIADRELRRQDCSVCGLHLIRAHAVLYQALVGAVRYPRRRRGQQRTAQPCLTAHGMSNAPSKYPPAFDIDLHVDDSEGVQIEGKDHGFRVVVVHPEDDRWAQKVLDSVAKVQAQLAWQQCSDLRRRCENSVRRLSLSRLAERVRIGYLDSSASGTGSTDAQNMSRGNDKALNNQGFVV